MYTGIFNQRMLHETANTSGDLNPIVPPSGIIEEVPPVACPDVNDVQRMEIEKKISDGVMNETETVLESAVALNRLADDVYLYAENTIAKIKVKAHQILQEAAGDGDAKTAELKKKGAKALIANIIEMLKKLIQKVKDIFAGLKRKYTETFTNYENWAEKAEPKVKELLKDKDLIKSFSYTGHPWDIASISSLNANKFAWFVEKMFPADAIGNKDKMQEQIQSYSGWSQENFKAKLFKDAYGIAKIQNAVTIMVSKMRGGEPTEIKLNDSLVNKMLEALKSKTSILNYESKNEDSIMASLNKLIEETQSTAARYADSEDADLVAQYVGKRVGLINIALSLTNLVITTKMQCILDQRYEYMKALSAFIKAAPDKKKVTNESAITIDDITGLDPLNESTTTSPKSMEFVPLTGIGSIKFGMVRDEVRKTLGKYKEFKKAPTSKKLTDDFGFCHVYYDKDDKCEYIEVFDETSVMYKSVDFTKDSFDKIKGILEKSGFTTSVDNDKLGSLDAGVNIHQSGKDRVIGVHKKGYYDRSQNESVELNESATGDVIDYAKCQALQEGIFGFGKQKSKEVVAHTSKVVIPHEVLSYADKMVDTIKNVSSVHGYEINVEPMKDDFIYSIQVYVKPTDNIFDKITDIGKKFDESCVRAARKNSDGRYESVYFVPEKEPRLLMIMIIPDDKSLRSMHMTGNIFIPISIHYSKTGYLQKAEKDESLNENVTIPAELPEEDKYGYIELKGTFAGSSVTYDIGGGKKFIAENKNMLTDTITKLEKEYKARIEKEAVKAAMELYPKWHDDTITESELLKKLQITMLNIKYSEKSDVFYVDIWRKKSDEFFGYHSPNTRIRIIKGKIDIVEAFILEG